MTSDQEKPQPDLAGATFVALGLPAIVARQQALSNLMTEVVARLQKAALVSQEEIGEICQVITEQAVVERERILALEMNEETKTETLSAMQEATDKWVASFQARLTKKVMDAGPLTEK